MNAIIIDTETTGFNEPEVIELAWECLTSGQRFQCRYEPTKEVEFGAIATHHIRTSDLLGEKPSCEVNSDIPSECRYFIAHNADFDWKMLGSPANIKRICTEAIARKLWPDSDSFKLTSLILQLYGTGDDMMYLVRNAHGAANDVLMCAMLLGKILEKSGLSRDDVETLWRFSEDCRIPDVFTFGKHKGEAIGDVPASYLQWFQKQPEIDPYLRIAIERALMN